MWSLFCHNDGHNEQYTGSVSVFLQLMDNSVDPIHCEFKFTLLHPKDPNKNIVKPMAGHKQHVFRNTDSNWGFYELIKYQRLIMDNYFWNEDSIVVEIDIQVTIGHRIQHESALSSYAPTPTSYATNKIIAINIIDQYKTPCTCTLKRDVAEILKSQSGIYLPDIILKVGLNEIQCHRLILIHRSSVFRAMFSCKMLESSTNEIQIEAASIDAMKIVIEYIYCDTFEVHTVPSFEIALEVFQLADRFDLDFLSELTVPIIARYLTVSNILAALKFSEDHAHITGGKQLKKAAQEFSRAHWEEMLDYASNMDFKEYLSSDLLNSGSVQGG